ncbi:hypothetical protein [Nonomuraea lactucae]|uniref:hypothetical protein n=1 Tax=Nonomuraea lactucae TaxID=2249762 RepID=UPI0013B40C2A|nr:hypothetical protein [Nonomuraea lactucae]
MGLTISETQRRPGTAPEAVAVSISDTADQRHGDGAELVADEAFTAAGYIEDL